MRAFAQLSSDAADQALRAATGHSGAEDEASGPACCSVRSRGTGKVAGEGLDTAVTPPPHRRPPPQAIQSEFGAPVSVGTRSPPRTLPGKGVGRLHPGEPKGGAAWLVPRGQRGGRREGAGREPERREPAVPTGVLHTPEASRCGPRPAPSRIEAGAATRTATLSSPKPTNQPAGSDGSGVRALVSGMSGADPVLNFRKGRWDSFDSGGQGRTGARALSCPLGLALRRQNSSWGSCRRFPPGKGMAAAAPGLFIRKVPSAPIGPRPGCQRESWLAIGPAHVRP
ncbi:hypothetical protein J1605_019966 [Eschrichtius robustus]|uniref:Uncharacterized protein n=1 Tax=Eschrichtius robustus TaxID=9764 RepID=A0AB34HNZ4_ESCRO|nr:hypothetical protein J1605_019966 [Eschrichtius robustus]